MLQPVSDQPLADQQFRRDLAACRALLRTGSRSFFAASHLLPRVIAERATALYAFCRIADDAVDEGQGDPDTIAMLRARVAAIYAGEPAAHPADRAFAHVARTCHVPREAVDALIEGFEWDAGCRRYATLAELEDYGARVAGCVGIMMTTVMGVRDRHTLSRAADLGVAMQLSNIARDVGEDARNGRLYLPLDWLSGIGLDADAFLANPQFTPELAGVVARLADRAEFLYRRALTGVADLPFGCRTGIRAAALLYRAIGREVLRRGGNSIESRAVVPGSTKLLLLARSLIPSAASETQRTAPALASTAFLVSASAAVAEQYPDGSARRPAPWWNLPGRAIPVLSIIEKLERLERGGMGLQRSRLTSQ